LCRAMLRRSIALLFRLPDDQGGAILIKVAIALLPLLTVVGIALDVSRLALAKQKLTDAVDAAGIAVGRHPELDAEDATSLAQSFVQTYYPSKLYGDLLGVTVAATGKQVDVTGKARVPMTLLQILGYKSVDINVSSMVLRQLRKIEVVMVLDNSGSMAGSRLTALKTSANTLVSALFGPETTSKFVKIGLVPFTGAVNVGSDNVGAEWLDSARLSPIHAEDIDLPTGKTLFDLFNGLANVGWGGCVRARVGPGGYDLTDEPPDAAVGQTLFVPYFAPDEPGTGNGPQGPGLDYQNDYLDDSGMPDDAVARQRNWSRYGGARVPDLDFNPPLGPNYNCPASPVLPLTDIKGAITSAINGMVAGGNTVIPEGIAWGWRVLSPGLPFPQGAPYSDQDTFKFLILLTDGENNVGGGTNHHNASLFSAFGFAASGHLGKSDGSQTRQVLDAKTAALCTNVKERGIFMYAIALQVTDGATRTMLASCASSECPGGQCYYESPTASALDTVFANIALGINQLRVAR
jgi:Flp pilus assembly protein TadG